MKYQPGLFDLFISPINGKLTSDTSLPSILKDYTWIGDRNNDPLASPILIDIRLQLIEIINTLSQAQFILQTAKKGFYNSQALDELEEGILKQKNGLISIAVPGSDFLPFHLPEGKIWKGSVANFPTETGLTHKHIFRGDATNKIVEVDDLSTLEGIVSTNGSTLSNLVSTVASLASLISTIQGALAAVEAGLASVGGWAGIAALQAQVLGIIAGVAALAGRVTDLEHALSSLNQRVNGLHLGGFVVSSVPDSNGLLATSRGPDCLLKNIPAGGDVSMNNFKIVDLNSDEVEQNDGLNAKFLWDLMHDEVGVVWL